MQLSEVKLSDIIEQMIPSDRIIVVANGVEMYKGYVANLSREKIKGCRIREIGLCTQIFRKKETERYIKTQVLGEEVSPERINELVFRDLEMLIYTKVVVEKM